MRVVADYNPSGLAEQGVSKVTIIPGNINSGPPTEKLRLHLKLPLGLIAIRGYFIVKSTPSLARKSRAPWPFLTK
jgi:hypothetical protein